MTPPAPRRIVSVWAAMWAIRTAVAEEAIEEMLWCSAYQTRSIAAPLRRLGQLDAAREALGDRLARGPTAARSRIESGTEASVTLRNDMGPAAGMKCSRP